MLLAAGFWQINTVSDLITIVGFVITLISIWFAWFLAKRDLEKRISDAQKQTVDRLAWNLLHPDVTESKRCMAEAKEASRAKRWDRAVDRCEQAKNRILVFQLFPGIDDEDRVKLVKAVDDLRLLINQLDEIIAGRKRTELSDAKIKDMDEITTTLATIEGKLRASGLR